MNNKDPGNIGQSTAIITSLIKAGGTVAGLLGAATILSGAVKPGMDGVAKMADAFVANKPAITAAGHGVGALGRSVSTLTAIATEPWPGHLLPWRR